MKENDVTKILRQTMGFNKSVPLFFITHGLHLVN